MSLRRWADGEEVGPRLVENIARELAIRIHKRHPSRDEDAVYRDIIAASEPPTKVVLYDVARPRCERYIASDLARFPNSGDAFYARRSIEDAFRRFVTSDRTAMVVVGESGRGKTTFALHALREYQEAGHLCLFVPSASLPSRVSDLERVIVDRLLGGDDSRANFWERIHKDCELLGKRLIVCIDAVNEYDGLGRGRGLTTEFLQGVEELIGEVRGRARNVRFLITSRPQTWKSASHRVQFDRNAYFHADGNMEWTVDRFSKDEGDEAVKKYFVEYRVTAPDRSVLTSYYLRDPLLLRLACEVYRGRRLPRDLDTRDLFAEFDRNQRARAQAQEIDVGLLIDQIVEQLFLPVGADAGADVIRRDAVALDPRLAETHPALDASLREHIKPCSVAFMLEDQNVIRFEFESRSVRFFYDRYAEHLLSESLVARILARASGHGARADAAFEVLRANLDHAPQLPTIFGALRQTLLELGARFDHGSKEYSSLLLRLATHDERGKGLVASVMAGIAMGVGRQGDGIETLAGLFDELKERNDDDTSALVIDAVSRMLVDAEYRAWLDGHEDKRARHYEVIDRQFVRGLEQGRIEIWAVTVQYLFFLWQSPQTREAAARITGRAVGQVETGRGLLKERMLLRNLTTLLFVTFAEAQDPALVREVLALAGRFLACFPASVTDSPLARTLIVEGLVSVVFRRLLRMFPNLVGLESLHEIFDDPGLRRDVQLVLRLLRTDTPWDRSIDVRSLLALLRSENGIIVEWVTFALSTRYERIEDEEARAEHLALIKSLFRTGEPIAEYAGALAMYHINYFGDRATPASMELMEEMAHDILKDRRGELPRRQGKERNFHIIGTYGRALRKNGHLLRGEAPADPRLLGFAIAALEKAKEDGTFRYYLYICQNIGLLGTLMHPADVLPVVSHILEDLGEKTAVSQDKRVQFPFSGSKDKARDSILDSLANFRVLYRGEIDRYLLDVVDSPKLLAEVATRRRPRFNLGELMSWTTEQLFYSLLNRYYDAMGSKLLDVIIRGFEMKRKEAMHYFVNEIFDHVRGLAAAAQGRSERTSS